MENVINDFSNAHIDILKEVGNIGAGNAATALAKMVNKKINMDVPKVRILGFKELNESFGGAELPVVGILLGINGDLTGSIMFILQLDAAETLIDMVMGDLRQVVRTRYEDCRFNEMEISAMKEIGNILTSSYLSALSMLTNLKIQPTIPDLAIDMAGAILSVPAIGFGKLGDAALYIETEFVDGDNKVIGDFYLIPDLETYDILWKALGATL